jgi:hypothetical protein
MQSGVYLPNRGFVLTAITTAGAAVAAVNPNNNRSSNPMLNELFVQAHFAQTRDESITARLIDADPVCHQRGPQECTHCLTAVVGVLFDGQHVYAVQTMTPDGLRRRNADLKRQGLHNVWWEFRTATLESSCM